MMMMSPSVRSHNSHSESVSLSSSSWSSPPRLSFGLEVEHPVISGVLYKWVNIGKGWHRRWFVLQDGVLSYYNIHHYNDSSSASSTSKIIGQQIICNNKFTSTLPLGQVHLKVSSIQESKSDHKRFSIFTGTKTLQLRALRQEDRREWIQELQSVKAMFPRISFNMPSPTNTNDNDNLVLDISTQKLTQRLMEEGVDEGVIRDSEHIMRTEFSALHNQILLLNHKQSILIHTLRHLELSIATIRSTLQNKSKDFPHSNPT